MGVKLGELIAELTPEDLRDVNARTRKHLEVIEDASRIDARRNGSSPPQEVEANIGIGRETRFRQTGARPSKAGRNEAARAGEEGEPPPKWRGRL